MKRARSMSVAFKLPAAIFATVAVLLALGLGLVMLMDLRKFESDLIDQSSLVARVVAEYSAADLAFGAREESGENLRNLRRDPRIVSAALYDLEGRLFSSFRSTGYDEHREIPERLTETAGQGGINVASGFVEASEPVVHEGRRYGTIQIRLSTRALDSHIQTYMATVGAIAVGLLLLSILFVFMIQRQVATPLLELSRVAEKIRRTGDFSTRCDVKGDREIETLSRTFDDMLAALEERETQRNEAQAAQERFGERLKNLHAIDRAVLAGQALSRIAQRALDAVGPMVGCSRGTVVELTPSLEEGSVLARLGTVSAERYSGTRIPLNNGSTFLQHLRAGRNYVLADSQDLAHVPRLIADLVEGGAAAAVCVPLYTENELIGSLNLALDRPGSLDAECIEIAQEVAELLAVAVKQRRLADEVARHTEELEERVERRTAQLAQSNRELEAFAYSVSHDLRAPLRAMQGFSTALAEDYGESLDRDGHDFLRRIITASERMDTLIGDLLDYSRLSLDSLEISPVDLSEVVDDACRYLGETICARDGKLEVDRDLGSVMGHRSTLMQVMSNLVSNAIKFVPDGEQPRVRICSEQNEGRVRVFVEDNGIGIAPDQQARIFRVFERLHSRRDYPGTGIGLAIVKRAAVRLQGSAGVESRQGAGSRFWVELPAAS